MGYEDGSAGIEFSAPDAQPTPGVDYAHLPALDAVRKIEGEKRSNGIPEFALRRLQDDLERLLAQPLFQQILHSTELIDRQQIHELFARDLELFKQDDENGDPLPYPKSIDDLYNSSTLTDVGASANLPSVVNYLAQKLNGYFPILSVIEMKREILKEKAGDPEAVARITKSIQEIEESLVPEATKIARLLIELKWLSDRQYPEHETREAAAK